MYITKNFKFVKIILISTLLKQTIMPAPVFTSQDIVDSINAYLAIIDNDAALISLFSQGNCFYYDYTQAVTLTTAGHVHAYPGIYRESLYFFMIPAEYDNEASMPDLATYTQACPIMQTPSSGGVGSHRIPDNIAENRINNWTNYYADWIPLQVASEFGMFKAFNIAKEDFESEDDLIYLGLADDTATPNNFDADLIVANFERASAAVVFDDFVRAVPPYSTVAAEQSFYLLSQ